MSNKPKIYSYKTLRGLTTRIRDDLKSHDFVLLFAYNGIGKTRLSTAFKDAGKKIIKKGLLDEEAISDTLYYNAFTEDLFSWDNDLEGDSERKLKLNTKSRFFDILRKGLDIDTKIKSFLHKLVDFDFKIGADNSSIHFSRTIEIKKKSVTIEDIKISRGEENVFIWCFFLAIIKLAMDKEIEAYDWVKYIHIDDPISSLDDNNAIAIAHELAQLLKQQDNIKTVISSHHALFFNVMCNELKKPLLKRQKYSGQQGREKCNELKKSPLKRYLLHRSKGSTSYSLRATDETPFFHHVAMLSELQKAVKTDKIYTYHFNILRGILEKTSVFFGFNDFSACIHGIEKKDKKLFSRTLNLLSHSNYSLYDPKEMVEDNKVLFKKILNAFLEHYQFDLSKSTVNTQRTKPL